MPPSSPSSCEPPRWWSHPHLPGWVLVLGVLVAGWLWLPLLDAPFLFDDHSRIRDNVRLFSEAPLHQWWDEPHPLRYLTFLVDRFLWGPTPGLWHLQNMVWHTASALLTGVLVSRVFHDKLSPLRRRWAAVAATLFVLGNPRVLECLGIVSHRKDLIATTLVLIAVLAALSRPRPATLTLAGLCALLAPFAKEPAIVLPGLVALVLWYAGTLRARWRTVLFLGVISLIATVDSLWQVQHASGDLFTARAGHHAANLVWREDGWFWISTNAILAWGRYLYSPFFGSNLSIEPHLTVVRPGSVIPVLSALIIVLLTCGALAYGFKKRNDWIVGFAWIVLSLALVLAPPLLANKGVFLFANRYLYLALPGFALLLVCLLSTRWGRGLSALLLLSCWVVSAHHVRDYTTEERFWKATLRENPTSLWAHGRLAVYYMGSARFGQAEHHYRKALGWPERRNAEGEALHPVPNPDCPDIHSAMANYAALHLQCGRAEQAEHLLQQTLTWDPEHPAALNTLAALRYAQHRYPESIQLLKRADRVRPGFAPVWYNIGNCHYRMGHLWEALEAWEKAQRLPFCPPEAAQKAAEVSRQLHER